MFKCEFRTDNAAFDGNNGGTETARILRQLADKIENSRDGSGTLHDINGNRIGHWSLAVSDR